MENNSNSDQLNGVMINAYPDSIGGKLKDIIVMLKLPEFKEAFSLFYVLPTFFNSDLDRGFSIIDYNTNKELVDDEDLDALDKLGIKLKFDIVLNHLSVASPQFKDLLKYGENSKYKDFFINWNTFWQDHGELDKNGIVLPKKAYLDKLFMRKSGLPILNVVFPDGSEQPYWNTFYQKVTYNPITIQDLLTIEGITASTAEDLCKRINNQLDSIEDIQALDFGELVPYNVEISKILKKNRSYLGQMDINAKSPLVWDFYEKTLAQLKAYGCSILRLDAFAYLHKAVGESNFFNEPGTWDYLSRIKEIADKNQLALLPEIHAEYGSNLHKDVARRGYQIYDFFLPGLLIHTIETKSNTALINWVTEILENDYKVVNMLGCHDGIPVLDLKGKQVNGIYSEGLLEDKAIESLMNLIIERGGKVKNLYGADGKKISYYQVNATFFSALGEDTKKMLLARAIQLFMPGIPQIWYLDIFEGKNDYEAVERAGKGGHKEINRTTLSLDEIHKGLKKTSVLKQLELIRLRNTHTAFHGKLSVYIKDEANLSFKWKNQKEFAKLELDLNSRNFSVRYSHPKGTKQIDS
ncbi:alpha-amylase family glycosyl hydrolase [Winogradskyella alexanderae]|uniref:Glycosidase n=1 Tax=Winogradskyella alexanderae TaxID=2877123 RepID=A0ABS7XUK8_9FLAO|nr:alpha-amylase family glycosyl hydrolase [Winogradskyella alexanderae]MCA0132491.1 glycosidase [Winogradskyella alexanderae]